ncbi:MAG: Dabb family protein [Phycisphaeraceae bacterium]|nr:Dabb family protein [Phycisphaeraceae bacterium]
MFKALALCLCASLPCCLMYGCSTSAPRPALISHIVLIDVKDEADIPAVLQDSETYLSRIPGVVSFAAGAPVDTGRDKVIADYDVGLNIGFDSVEAYNGYVTHPDHVGLVTKWTPRFNSLRIYDFMDGAP